MDKNGAAIKTDTWHSEWPVLTGVTLPNGGSVTITRNNRGETVAVTDEENRTVSLERDVMGRIIKEISPSGKTVHYQWGTQ